MNKSQFVDLVKETGAFKTKVEAENAIKAVTNALTQVMAKKDSIILVGFGTFAVNFKPATTGKVPGTDRTYTTEEKHVPKFKAGKLLKDAVAKV